MTFAAAYSEHPVAAAAAGEAIGRIVEVGGTSPDLVMVFASAAHTEFLGEITSAVRSVLGPRVLLGAAAHSIIGERRESDDAPALSLWASWNGPVTPVRLSVTAEPTFDGEHLAITGLPDDIDQGATLLLLADPRTFPAEPLIDELARRRPDVPVVGGLASTAGSHGSALIIDDQGYTDGAIGALIPRDQLVGPVVSQGCRPVGEPMVVTAARGNYLIELAGQLALGRLTELANTADESERVLLAGGVQLGIVVDEHRDDPGTGDFLVRSVLGADRERGVLAIGGHVEIGTTVQFHARDATTASHDLQRLLDGVAGDGALVFTCTGRGSQMFGVADHDATVVAEQVGTEAVGGMFCAGEFGPIGGRSHVHSFTASVLVFASRRRR